MEELTWASPSQWEIFLKLVGVQEGSNPHFWRLCNPAPLSRGMQPTQDFWPCRRRLEHQSDRHQSKSYKPMTRIPTTLWGTGYNSSQSYLPSLLTTGGPRKQTNVTRFTPTPIIRVGDEGLNRTEDLSGDVLEHPSWHPLDTNSLEDSRAFNSDIFTVVLGEGNLTADGGPHPLVDRSSGVSADEIKEPVLRQAVWAPIGKTSSSSVRRNGSRSEDPLRPEITEPVLNPKTLVPASITSTLKPSVVRTRHISDLSPPPEGSWSSWRSDAVAEEPSSGQMQTVQLFPQRLASILAQAERYARTTLVQTPTGNSQNNTSTDESSAQTQRRAKLMTTDGPDDVTVSPIIDARGVGGIVRTSQGSQVLVPYSYSSADSSSNQNTRFIPLSYPKDSSAPLSARQPSESIEGTSKGKNEDSRFGGYFNIFYQLFSKIPPSNEPGLCDVWRSYVTMYNIPESATRISTQCSTILGQWCGTLSPTCWGLNKTTEEKDRELTGTPRGDSSE
uniref:Uncharacterized protein n=1 Tax=Timema monikensis TaxID=170555 RepID=A0A7R9ELY0_9NEOP|nr:unnamed protein product [Timema monikensis]